MPRRRLIFLIVTAFALLSAGWAARSLLHRWETDQDYESAKAALELGRFREASELGLRLANSSRYRSPGLLIAGEAAARQGQAAEALALYRRVPFSEPALSDTKGPLDLIAVREPEAARFARASLLAQGEILLNLTPSLGEAESVYRRALAIDSNSVVAHERLAFILGLQGRAREAAEHRVALLRLGHVLPIQLVLLALGETADENPETVARFLNARPNDPAALRAAARIAAQRERQEDLLRQVAAAVSAEPEVAVAQAWLGRVLLRRQDNAGYRRWLEDLPASAADAPEVWLVFAEQAAAANDVAGAVRCYAEATQRDPNYLAAVTGLARMLQIANDPNNAQRFRERAKRLEQLATAARTHQISGSRSALLQAAEMAAELGLAWESWGWYDALNQHERFEDERKRAAETQYALARRDPLARVLPSGRIAESFAWQRFPLPPTIAARDAGKATYRPATADHAITGNAITSKANIGNANNGNANTRKPNASQSNTARAVNTVAAAAVDRTVVAELRADSSPSSTTGFRFVAEPRSTGIDFAFHNGHRSEVAGEYMYEFSGGAAAVLDYDLDGWPDLYLSQGTDWPPRESNFAHLDHLCRNMGDGRFVNVAELAGVRENRFSQGVAVADFDNDGFPDLYIGNIGANRLYRNNGDGTFTDVTSLAGVAGDDWTSSIAPADFNNDGLIDLYVGNYLQGEHLFDRPCLLPDGSTRLCTPHEFAAAQDRVYVNEGDGRFRDVTAECGVAVPDGKTLGVVAGDFDGSGRASVFTANDAVPNFLFVNESADDSVGERGDHGARTPRFAERAFLAGVAVDNDGRAQACMGIAAGDANGDGRLDLFATNFRNEANVLYVAQEGMAWLDRTRAAGLHAPSFDLLGFGTQFLDADLDGDQDLVLVNGHVGDLRQHGVAYRMRPQIFENRGAGVFEERRGASAGPYFDGEYLGRGLARLDWNRDGRPDFAVNQLLGPAALVTNHTPPRFRSVAVRLIGTRSNRDAIGATVTVTAADRRETQQLLSGDGYMASNERLLCFTLPAAEAQVEIRWPAGGVWRSGPLVPARLWTFVE